MTILSFQSSVAYGYVGNAAAVFCLRRAGHEVWPVDTVAFSNHPGHGSFRGRVVPASEIADIIDGMTALGVLDGCRAILSGYMGSAETGSIVLQAVRRIKAADARALYCCDPVMGDRDPGLYVTKDLTGFFRNEAVPAADVLVPNHFELEVLAERPLPSTDDVLAAADALLNNGPRIIVVTSLATHQMDPRTIGNLVVTRDGAWLAVTPRLPLAAKGAGDALAAMFLGDYLRCRDATKALSQAVSAVFAIVEATAAAGASELRLVASQDAIVDPPRLFPADKLR